MLTRAHNLKNTVDDAYNTVVMVRNSEIFTDLLLLNKFSRINLNEFTDF